MVKQISSNASKVLRMLGFVFFLTAIAFPAFAESGALGVKNKNSQTKCPWDLSLVCAKFELEVGNKGNNVRINLKNNEISLYPPDVEFQVFDGKRWSEYAPVLAVYDRYDAILALRDGARFIFFVDITPAIALSEKRQFRISIADASGKHYYSSPFHISELSPLSKSN